MDRNSQFLGISYESLKYMDINPAFHRELQTQKFKIVDCKLFYTLIEEMRRQRKIKKITDDSYIFIQKSTFNNYSSSSKNQSKVKGNKASRTNIQRIDLIEGHNKMASTNQIDLKFAGGAGDNAEMASR